MKPRIRVKIYKGVPISASVLNAQGIALHLNRDELQGLNCAILLPHWHQGILHAEYLASLDA